MPTGRFLRALALAAGCLAQPAAAELIGDAQRGAHLFERQCTACHQIGAGAINRVGPQLNGIFGRRAGTAESFKYSKAMTRMGNDGLTWTLETLDPYLANPKALVSGTRMNYPGLADDTGRADLLAYLRDYSDRPRDIPEAEPTARKTTPGLDPAILALEGDAEYGAYLSSECATCHQADGSDQGIPSITGWPPEDFVVALHAYKQKLRPHPVMQMMAGRLSNEEIAALAAYFTTQGQ
ncbi:c-type cytochrome [Paracoccaceae bacterium Fryx2]|nr:c-type cytochrome [Paracoccaceae bacterium Fryx2]